jgi:release factor glutamine methyltransferase
VAYIRGLKEFYGLEFHVDRRVLIPRPETELLVEKAIEWIAGKAKRTRGEDAGPAVTVADVGTGSGCIAVSLAVNLPEIQVYAIDPSPQALEVASLNCHRHGVGEGVRLLEGAMLDPLPEQVDAITANLPYVRTRDLALLPRDIRDYEPLFALDGGEEGLDAIWLLLRQAPSHLRPGGTILLEIGCHQGEAVKEIALGHFPGARVRVFKDYAGVERVVAIETEVYS